MLRTALLVLALAAAAIGCGGGAKKDTTPTPAVETQDEGAAGGASYGSQGGEGALPGKSVEREPPPAAAPPPAPTEGQPCGN